MTTGMHLWDADVWSFVLTLSLLFAAMIAANILRRLCPFIRKALIPSSVLGGFLLLLANAVARWGFHHPLFSTGTLEILTYHGLGLGFAALALRNTEKKTDGRSRTGAFDTGVTVVNGYLLQAVLGLIVTIGLYYAIRSFYASGLLLPMGYGQGPGQAYNWGHNYEMQWGFENGTSFGLAVAAMGFVSASVGGVIYLNWLRREDLPGPSRRGRQGQRHTLDLHRRQRGADLGIDGQVHDPACARISRLRARVPLYEGYKLAARPRRDGREGACGNGAGHDLGLPVPFQQRFRHAHQGGDEDAPQKGVMHREYTNTFMQNRIAGFMFDLMVVASIAAIDLSAFRDHRFVLPLTIISIVGAFGTYFYLRFVCARVFPWYEHEAFLSLYGMQTGTASTGVILLREIDPQV